MAHRSKTITAFIIIGLVLAGYAAYAFDLPKWFPFNQENALDEWKEKIFKNRVLYVIETDKEDGYLLAKSKEACSGLLYKLKFYPRDLPMIRWQWKVTQFPQKKEGQEDKGGWLEKDDYAARVYVIFSSWNILRIESLEYVWDENLPEGTVMTSPYFANLKLIVAESGRKNLNHWVSEERNIFEDYKKAFGREPHRYVTAVALMTDSDNTLSTAEAFYKDLKVGYRK